MTEQQQHALYERFLRGLALSPDGPALRLGPVAVSYRDLHERALTVAGSLGPAKVVAVLADKSLTAYAGILAGRSEERRVGKECTVLCRSRWSPYH